ncbi:MAG: LptA/OstA family protein [Nitratireductor sp.]
MKTSLEKTSKFIGAILVSTFLMSVSANAQSFSGAFSGMQDSNQPVQIQADRLEVKDGQGLANFAGNVEVVQGSTVLKASKLTVYYSKDQSNNGPAGNVRRIIASGKVAVRSGAEQATADKADVDMRKQVALLTGGVTLTQGNNIVQGCTLKINLANNDATLTPCKSKTSGKKGRVTIMFDTKSAKRP